MDSYNYLTYNEKNIKLLSDEIRYYKCLFFKILFITIILLCLKIIITKKIN